MSALHPSGALIQDLDRLERRLSHAEGRREGLRRRRAALEREIALAKARLDSREAVEAFIEEVQAEASRRSIQSFETLLSAFVQEVLPGEKPVALDLATERGLPALDICVARSDGAKEDVLEDNGGALTNVIGMALRLIAVVKSGVGRFLALDEADCWIAPDRVPAFYRVLEDSAARLGVQCLAISHHDISAFNERLRVARVAGDPETGVTVVCPDPDGAWDEESGGIRSIRLVDVQGYRDATLTLAPGVNALIGPNNRGKSTFIRALRAVFYGEARDSLVRAGAAAATVEIGLAKGRLLRFSRQPRRTPVNLWSLHDADGTVVAENGVRFETGGRAAPAWVGRLCGIVKVEDLDVHIAHQKFPVFLLGEAPSRRSAVLSIGQEAGYIRGMLAIHRERCHQDLGRVRQGERELVAINEALAALDELPGLGEDLAAARAVGTEIAAAEAAIARLEILRDSLAATKQRLAGAETKRAALQNLPDAADAAQIVRAVEDSREHERIAGSVFQRSRALTTARRRTAALSALPDAPPMLDTSEAAEIGVAQLARLRQGLKGAFQRTASAEAEMEAIAAEIAAIAEEFGGLCPTCGAAADADALLKAHTHKTKEAA
jgi:hypothetical protein